MTPPLLVLKPLRTAAMERLAAGYRLHRADEAKDPDALIGECAGEVRGIVTAGDVAVTRALVERCPLLEIVACCGVGTDNIDLDACRERGIAVTNTPDVLSADVADLGIALMLASLRGLVVGDRQVREGQWPRGELPLATGAAGKRLGIVGLGSIGRAVARRAAVMEMEIGYHNRRPREDVDYRYHDSVGGLAAWADVLLLSCPGGPATRHLIDAEVLAALGRHGHLVNIARGSVVDEEALIKALESGVIAGAALDVFENEPHVPEPLRQMPHIVLQPHRASATVETRDAMAALAVDNLDAHFQSMRHLTRVV